MLHEIISRLIKDWSPGVRGVSKKRSTWLKDLMLKLKILNHSTSETIACRGLCDRDVRKTNCLQVSMGVASVVRDYIEEMPATLGQDLESQQQKVGLCTNIPVLWRSAEAFFA